MPHLMTVVILSWLSLLTLILLSLLEWLRQTAPLMVESPLGGLPIGGLAPDLGGLKILTPPVPIPQISKPNAYTGGLAMVFFLSPTCTGCRALAQDLPRRVEEWRQAGVGEVRVVVRASDEAAAIGLFPDMLALQEKVLLLLDGSNRSFSSYQVSSVPFLYMLDANSRVLATGPGTMADALLAKAHARARRQRARAAANAGSQRTHAPREEV